MNKYFHYLLTLILLLSGIGICAARTVTIKGNIYDRLTADHLPGTHIAIMSPDSVTVRETEADYEGFISKGAEYQFVKMGKFTVEIPDSISVYILKATHEKYEPLYHIIDLSVLGKKQYEMELPPLYMSPEGKTTDLDDVVVKATKIKFYNKGDTIVYNADAFQLPEGSMLDALIAQLPGVEIKDGGKIYVNGKYVESLLLNGKDFFKGNPEVMKQNIGAYSVKSIEVYDKYNQLSTLLGTEVEGDSEYVMDVKLKKDYMGGFMGNVEAGYGTHGRYTGRLFAMMFNNLGSLALYANVNNLNEATRPSSNDGFSAYTRPDPGTNNIANGGLDYSAEDMKKVWKVNGNVNVMYTDNLLTTNQLTESFLQGNNEYRTSISRARNYNLRLNTTHRFAYNKPMYYLRIEPDFSYSRMIGNNSSQNVTFNSNIQERYDVDSKLIEALYSSHNPEEIRQAIVNRNNFIRKNRNNTWMGHVYNENSIKIPKSPDAITFWIEGQYERQHSWSQTSQRIDLGYNPTVSQPLTSQARQNSVINYPSYDLYAKGGLRYLINRKYLSYSFSYEFRHEQTRKTNEEYLFEALAENNQAVIPDVYTEIADLPNTNKSKLFNNIHKFRAKFDYRSKERLFGDWQIRTGLGGEYHIMGRHLDYMGYASSGAGQPVNPVFIPISRISGNFKDCRAYFNLVDNSKNYKSVYLSYSLNTLYASLLDMVDLPNTSDPLNLYRGNPDLKNTLYQEAYLSSYMKLGNHSFNFYHNTTWQHNTVVRGYTLDRQTGVREYRSYNAEGFLRSSTWAGYRVEFGHFSIEPGVDHSFSRYPSFVGENGPAERLVTYNTYFEPELRLRYYVDEVVHICPRISYNMQYTHSSKTSNRTSILTPGILAWWALPFGLELEANYSFSKLYGLADKSMRDTYNNLALSVYYKVTKDLTLGVKGIDILNVGSKPSIVTNFDNRTETFQNTLPRYFLFTVFYKFNTKKK